MPLTRIENALVGALLVVGMWAAALMLDHALDRLVEAALP